MNKRTAETNKSDKHESDSMDDSIPKRWAFGSLVDTLPRVNPSDKKAVAIQFGFFTALLFIFAFVYNLWSAVGAGAVAIAVSSVGSVLMLDISERVREVELPDSYQKTLFSSGFDVLLGVVGTAVLLTYLVTIDQQDGTTFITLFLGQNPPIIPTFFSFILFWDVCYRIGTAWWAAIGGLWRAYHYDFNGEKAELLQQVDVRVLGFGLLQLAFVPFIASHPILAAAIIGHAVAVTVVTGTTMVLSW